jgi:hypothetical protein
MPRSPLSSLQVELPTSADVGTGRRPKRARSMLWQRPRTRQFAAPCTFTDSLRSRELGSLLMPWGLQGALKRQPQAGLGNCRVGRQRLAFTGGSKADPLVQAVSSGVVVGHPQDHLSGSAFGRPAHGLVDQGTGHTPPPVARVDPHRHQVHASRSVGLSEDRGQADVDAALARDEVRRRRPTPARCRQTSSRNATSASRVLAKASGASASARSRSCRSAAQSAACACRTSMPPPASPAPDTSWRVAA